MNDTNLRNLACAIIMQAVKDYFEAGISDKERKAILKDLCSTYMDTITNGTSLIVAEQLELHPDEIYERLQLHHEIV